MRISAHITFFYDRKRLVYLKDVVYSLLALDHRIDIFIYSNNKFDFFPNSNNIKCLYYQYTNNGLKFSYKSVFNKLGMKRMIHPYYLTWENRNVIEESIDTYDIQIYLEDDMKFTKANLNYWLKYSDLVTGKGYNLGFLRIEFNEKEMFFTDLDQKLTEVIYIDNKKYIVNNINTYCGFWIYSKEELKKFVKSKEWNFNFKNYGKREKSAIGWHGAGMSRYKNTIIPLEEDNNQYITPKDCTIHHLPNNYINHGSFCSVKFPITIEKNKHN